MPVKNYRAYYAANRERFKAYHRASYLRNKKQRLANNRQRRVKLQARVNIIKLGPCHDCDQRFNVHCMQFDHREPKKKSFNIATAVAQCYAWKKIDAEIEKCDLVCANCHALRTWRQRHGSDSL